MQWLYKPPALVEIAPNQFLHADIVDDVKSLQLAAKKAGISIDIASGYRSVERQIGIWNAKWNGERPLFSRSGHQLNHSQLSDNEKLNAILIWSALPGASRHHWGTDFDVYDKPAMDAANLSLQLIETEYENDAPCAALSNWLGNNAKTNGFSRPYIRDMGGIAREPWHISHIRKASEFEKELNIDTLSSFIEGIEIAGKSAIMSNLGWIYPKFVLNEGDYTK